MPKPGMTCRQVIISTKSSWLPGDERGWRSRGHKRHSSGDYKNPPPKNEHEGLRRLAQEQSQKVVEVPWGLRARLGVELVRQFIERGYRVLCGSVSKRHSHLLVELPIDLAATKRIVGLCKGASSHAVRDVMPGNLWSEGAKYELIVDESHHHNVYEYILYKQGPGAFTWSFQDEALAFIPGRKRPACENPKRRSV
jgi:hypothetical protein